jgi:hypothetical protein
MQSMNTAPANEPEKVKESPGMGSVTGLESFIRPSPFTGFCDTNQMNAQFSLSPIVMDSIKRGKQSGYGMF